MVSDNLSGVIVLQRNRAVYSSWKNAPTLPAGAYVLSQDDSSYGTRVGSDGEEHDDYIYADVRALSASKMAYNSPRSLDTSYKEGKAVKDAVPLYVGMPLKVDHETAVEAVVGKVVAAWWQEPQIQKGKEVPGGVNVRLAIEKYSKVAKGFMDGTIRSVSSTFNFTPEPSHPELTTQEAIRLMGQDVNGRRVTRQVAAIHSIEELSAVQEGMDVFAKVLKRDGSIDMSNYLMFKESLSKHSEEWYEQLSQALEKDGKIGVPCVDNFEGIYSSNPESTMDTETTEQLQERLSKQGIQLEEATNNLLTTQEKLTKAEAEVVQQKSAYSALVAEKASLSQQLQELTTERETLRNQLQELNAQVSNINSEKEALAAQVKAFTEAEQTALVEVLTHAHANASSLAGKALDQAQVSQYKEALSIMPLVGLKALATAQGISYSDMFWGKASASSVEQEQKAVTTQTQNLSLTETIALTQ